MVLMHSTGSGDKEEMLSPIRIMLRISLDHVGRIVTMLGPLYDLMASGAMIDSPHVTNCKPQENNIIVRMR